MIENIQVGNKHPGCLKTAYKNKSDYNVVGQKGGWEYVTNGIKIESQPCFERFQ